MRGAMAWMVRNQVTANILALFLIFGGLIVGSQLRQEVFPEVDLDIVQILVEYPGASPEEVENGILLSIENEVRGIEGVKQVRSYGFEGIGVVSVEMLANVDRSKALQDVKNRVDSIRSFPENAETPVISLVETKRQVISVILYGDVPSLTLRKTADKVRQELIELPGITLVEMSGVPPLEIAIEIPQATLRRYNLTLDQVAQLVRNSAVELPGGAVKSAGGDILLRTNERRDWADEYRNIPVVSLPSGSAITLGEIGTIEDRLEDTEQESYFNGIPAIKIDVFRTGDQTPIEVSELVNTYVKKLRSELPASMGASIWDDRADLFRDRMSLLIGNALQGLFLVLILLGLFLEPRLAFWVTLGIPFSIFGSFFLLGAMDISISMVSMFAYLLTLGIVVDDSIVVGENIYQKREQGLPYVEAAIQGVQEVSTPVLFAVLTNMTSFVPLLLVPGTVGKIFFTIPAVVLSVFLVSLFEAFFVLPAHLAGEHKKSKFWTVVTKPSLYFDRLLNGFLKVHFQKYLHFALKHRYLTVASGIGLLIVAISFVLTGFLPMSFLPRIDNDLVEAEARLPFGAPMTKSREVAQSLVQGAEAVLEKHGGRDIAKGIFTQIGTSIIDRGPTKATPTAGGGSHIVGVQVFLVPTDKRTISGIQFANEWRETVGEFSGVESIRYNSTIGVGAGDVIDIELAHPEKEIDDQAARELALQLANYKGAFQIDNGVKLGKPQINFTLTPQGRSLGITTGELARQLRASFFGSESLRLQRGRDEITVYVRLPLSERKTPYTVENLIIRAPNGEEIPLSEAAHVHFGRAYTEILRTDGRRIVSVTADVDVRVANANNIVEDVERNVLPKLMEKYPGLAYSMEGEQKEQGEILQNLTYGFILALICIYTLLAIAFNSYVQPLILMMSIPFGIIGAIGGHLLLGYELSMMSMFGMIALSGVVVNDSIVLLDTANRAVEEEPEKPIQEIIVASSLRRFRPIMLTSLTTFFGLAPMTFDTSVQARFLIPMSISLSFGALFATSIILILAPCLYLITKDIWPNTQIKRN